MEFVYVAKRRDLFDLETPHGFRTAREAGLDELLGRVRSRGFFVERRHAETDATLKQIIPYVVVAHGDEIFTMRRKRAGGEARLHGLRSIGVGGHINPVDDAVGSDVDDLILEAARREIDEEIVVPGGVGELRAVGLINDDASPVGAVHLGVVFRAVAPTASVVVRETEVLEGAMVPRGRLSEDLAAARDSFETWSALILDRFEDLA